MKHLQVFNYHGQFEYGAPIETDSYVMFDLDAGHVHYSSDIPTVILSLDSDGTENSYKYIDLDLPSGAKWAQCNIGATNPCDIGLLFQYGRVDGYAYGDKNHHFTNSDSYTTTSGKVYTEGQTLNPEDDAATVNMGGNWHMPNKREIDELFANTTNSWVNCDVEHEGKHTIILGRLFVSKKNSSKKLFLPTGGYWDPRNFFNGKGWCSYYCGSELYHTYNTYSIYLTNRSCTVGYPLSEDGLPVRAVCYTEFLNENDWVDLGLPSGTKWAKCNLGASNPYEAGDYYMWASTTPNTNDVCDLTHVPYHTGSSIRTGWTKYNNKRSYGTIDYKTVLDTEDDAAYIVTNGKAYMPTKAQMQELIDNTTTQQTTINGIRCRIFTAKNGNSICIPISGWRQNSTIYSSNANGYIWSSSHCEDYPSQGQTLVILTNEDLTVKVSSLSRDFGVPIRPVSNLLL